MLNGAVIGFGRMGITHHAILNSHPNVKMVAACDTSGFVIENLEKLTGVKGLTDSRKTLDLPGLDFVIIATPTGSHAELIRESVKRGLHVFVEKPFTLEVKEGFELAELAAKARLVNQVGYVNRFNEVFVAVKEIVASGVLGELHHFRCAMYAPTVLRPPKEGWRGQRKTGGGCLLDYASHGIDLSHFMFGEPNRIAGSAIRSIYSKEAEDAVYSTFLYKSGLSGHLAVNWSDESYRKPAYRFELEATNGRIYADHHAYKLYLRKPSEDGRFNAGWTVRYATDLNQPVRFYLRGNEFTRQLDYFVDQVAARQCDTNVSSFASAATTDRTIQAILDDAASK